ncbi:MAG: hypothetical protein M1820_007089 [Bogoriella megaspora]|nr:MAG: hypothetical protein M1820_007089 [Bogoriella megaspora]
MAPNRALQSPNWRVKESAFNTNETGSASNTNETGEPMQSPEQRQRSRRQLNLSCPGNLVSQSEREVDNQIYIGRIPPETSVTDVRSLLEGAGYTV